MDTQDFGDVKHISKFTDDELCNELRRRRHTGPLDVNIRLGATMFDDVGAFHRQMSLPYAGANRPRYMDHGELKFRLNFIYEELIEFVEANAQGRMYDCADALADLAWVVLGTAQHMRIPFNEVWDEVRRANMAKRPWKEGDPVKPRNIVGLEVTKPAGWRGPDIQAVFDNYLIDNGWKNR